MFLVCLLMRTRRGVPLVRAGLVIGMSVSPVIDRLRPWYARRCCQIALADLVRPQRLEHEQGQQHNRHVNRRRRQEDPDTLVAARTDRGCNVTRPVVPTKTIPVLVELDGAYFRLSRTALAYLIAGIHRSWRKSPKIPIELALTSPAPFTSGKPAQLRYLCEMAYPLLRRAPQHKAIQRGRKVKTGAELLRRALGARARRHIVARRSPVGLELSAGGA